ncbi:MAG: inositol monophosphatase family protein [Legionellaceae bacterium]|nr:inositol monophosphatase family protein [Legionellaceae bacterium]
MEPLLNIAVTAARQAGDIIIRHAEQLERIKITQKAKNDYFSEVDIKAEQSIIRSIQKAYPDHGIIAEESGVQNPDADCVWFIDPLDGTSNYLHGFPAYCVSIAMTFQNRLEHAVIYDPLRHECFSASRGRGARLNDRRIRVSKKTELQTAMLGSGPSVQNPKRAEKFDLNIQPLLEQCTTIRRIGAAALELAYVACGRLDGFFEFGLRPWDVAAGCLLIQEAGGFVSDPKGGQNFVKQGSVIAGTPKVFDEIHASLKAK